MPIHAYGGYTPLTIAPEVLTAAPKTVQQLWGKVTTVQGKVDEARDLLTLLEHEAQNAAENDRQAAREAVASGKPVPEPTVEATQFAADQQRRAVQAVTEHADAVEANFLNALNDHRNSMIDDYRALADRNLEDAVAALKAADEAILRFTMASSCWNWARADEDRTPPSQGFRIPTGVGQSVDALIDISINALDKEAPERVEQAEADYLAAYRAQAVNATGDGLMIDDIAGRRAAAQMMVD